MFNKILKFVKRHDTILYILGLVIVGLLLIGVVNCFAYGVETVKDDNDGNKGYILINTGKQNGNSDVGHWTNIADVPELKGEKGDKGDTGTTGLQGIQGIQGLKGDTGLQGIAGLNGLDGLKGEQGIQGEKGNTGEQGIQGLTGDKGDKGNLGEKGEQGIQGKDVDPTIVTNLQNEDITLNNSLIDEVNNRVSSATNLQSNINTETTSRINADNQLNLRIDDVSNRVSKLERTQYKLQIGIRVFDSKRITITPYISQNFTRSCIDEVGVRVTIKLGTSYEEREIAKTNTRLGRLEQYLALPEVQEGITQAQMRKIKVTTDGRSFRIDKEF